MAESENPQISAMKTGLPKPQELSRDTKTLSVFTPPASSTGNATSSPSTSSSGDAAAVFQLCNIYGRVPLLAHTNMVTAQGTVNSHHNTGISIGNILATPKLEVAVASAVVSW
ncbi:putative pectinesterase/pectinesterase inhibitor 36 [Nymphaea thermarum]|nr:putative pectinesterase/pectinesterase inhibitor 36 [Nymphaea thermarum]